MNSLNISIKNRDFTITILLILLLIVIIYNLFRSALNSHEYIVGDWLINFHDSGGFKRRGLMGSIVFFVQDFTNLPLNWIVFFIQITLYSIYFFTLDFF